MAAAVQSLAAGSCHEPFARGFIQALLWRWSRCSCRVFMSTQSQWVLLCGLRVALLACEDGHGESPFPDLCAVESGVGIQWKSAVRAPGSCSCPWFAVTCLAKSLSLQSKLQLCRQGWRVQVFCSSTVSLYKQSPDSSLVIPECL